jgi:hypothetical protein
MEHRVRAILPLTAKGWSVRGGPGRSVAVKFQIG